MPGTNALHVGAMKPRPFQPENAGREDSHRPFSGFWAMPEV